MEKKIKQLLLGSHLTRLTFYEVSKCSVRGPRTQSLASWCDNCDALSLNLVMDGFIQIVSFFSLLFFVLYFPPKMYKFAERSMCVKTMPLCALIKKCIHGQPPDKCSKQLSTYYGT